MKQSVSEYQKAFIARTKKARKRAHMTQKQMGHALGRVPQDIYKNYETIRELPHEYIPTFCLVCGVTADWLFDVEAVAKQQSEVIGLSNPKKEPINPTPSGAAEIG